MIILDLEILLSYLILSCLFFKTQKTILIYDKIGLQPVSRPLEQPFLDFESVGKSVQKVYAQKRQLKYANRCKIKCKKIAQKVFQNPRKKKK